MFGYVKTDTPNMYVKDTVLYRSMYCGLCKGIGCTCGQRARLSLSYDLAFLSVLAHNLTNEDIKIEKQHCIIHWFDKKPVATVDELTKRIACLNVILAYHKCNDDVLDNGKGRAKRSFFKKAYKKAKKAEPTFDKIVNQRYADLLKIEKKQTDNIDMSADPFGIMMQEIVKELLKDACDENVSLLAYNLGKWIYLIDALDDFDKDKKKKTFNVFVNAYPKINDKNQLIKEYSDEIKFIFGSVLNVISDCARELNYKFNHDLTDNILMLGLRDQTTRIMENNKCKKTTKF